MAPDRTRLFVGDYIIDLHRRNDVTYYAISRNGSDDIISMGHETSYEEAEESARWTIDELEKGTYQSAQSSEAS